ncbi:MAG: hypothetical protein MJ072_05150, partial [Clostridia bacterium]|nr:hypothetical protein [Clostridia bacterium]
MRKKLLGTLFAVLFAFSALFACSIFVNNPKTRLNASADEATKLTVEEVKMSDWAHEDRPITLALRCDYVSKDGRTFTDKGDYATKVSYQRGDKVAHPIFVNAAGYNYNFGFKMDGMVLRTPEVGDRFSIASDYTFVFDGVTYTFGKLEYVYNGVNYVNANVTGAVEEKMAMNP